MYTVWIDRYASFKFPSLKAAIYGCYDVKISQFVIWRNNLPFAQAHQQEDATWKVRLISTEEKDDG